MMTNTHQKIIEEVMRKLAASKQAGSDKTLSDVAKLKRDLALIGAPIDADTVLRMPYSSMPKLSATHNWK